MARILIVEDEPIVMNVLRMILKQDGHDVLEAATAEGAIDMARHAGNPVHLVITNHTLVKTSGRAVVEEILKSHPHAEVLRISGHLRRNLEREGEIRPESHFLQKPFRPNELREKVREILGAGRT